MRTGMLAIAVLGLVMVGRGPSVEAAGQGVLLVGVGIHVEPFGLTNGQITSGRASYDSEDYFRRHADLLRTLADTVEAHGGRLTIQVQSPFTDSCAKYGDNVIGELHARGHEIALHFHEDAHLGRNSEALPVSTWTETMEGQLAKIRALGVDRVRMWSGGNLYTHLLEAAAAVGLDVMSDWKNPLTQTADSRLQVTTPWRPAGSPSESDLSAFVQHDPAGAIVYLPTGAIDPKAMHADEIDSAADPAAALQAYWTEGLSGSLSSASAAPSDTHVFHITLHPGELQTKRYGGDRTLDDWLTDEIDPLVAAGKAKWATYSAMKDAYSMATQTAAARTARASIQATSLAGAQTADDLAGSGYITFAVNVHDWKHLDESADTLLRAVDVFEKHRVRGDFYLTGVMADLYQQRRPDVITRLRDSGMTISYHVRAPHPLYAGFDDGLEAMDETTLRQTLVDYETYALDLATGGLDRSRAGGYRLVTSLFGSPPVTIGTPTDSNRVAEAARRVYRDLGARAIVVYHETGTKPDEPFEWKDGLLVRPSDFSVTRWSAGGSATNFWWNMLQSRWAGSFEPTAYLQQQLTEWSVSRPPLITALIHENNFVRSGAEGWTLSFYSDTSRATPLSAPFDLEARDPSTPRSATEQDAIWAAYDQLVGWAAANLTVVTSADLVELAGST